MAGRRVGAAAAAAAAAALVVLAAVSATFIIAAHASSSPKSFVNSTISAHDVVIFSNSYCPDCKTAKDLFKELDLKKEPYVVELDQREDGLKIQDALVRITGFGSVPHVFIHGKHLGVSELLDIILRDTDPDQVSFHGKNLGRGALKILLRLAKVENWVNFVNIGVKDDDRL